ncbi:unnamed protein product [Prorocentrum cordatum]|uniref:Uncharacterized protein n=1 Tax=Prorocentrum cordatum TaxID=2364126 RepID=A0ABN9T4N8_9DINO|nr:unnamed protein product [Polarella glacialis]|mmetsp:Transcript_65371/g.176656  ORF Transcript_65371/g.176656 Transcript_65371/m.176656 type:complete len:119 (-) Transcript_65371:416-772(-)
MAARLVVVREGILGASAPDKRDEIVGVEVKFWVENTFVCVADPDKIRLPEKRCRSLPPRKSVELRETSAPPRNGNAEVQHIRNRGKRCKWCRGRKGDSCRCIYKASSQVAMCSMLRSG